MTINDTNLVKCQEMAKLNEPMESDKSIEMNYRPEEPNDRLNEGPIPRKPHEL